MQRRVRAAGQPLGLHPRLDPADLAHRRRRAHAALGPAQRVDAPRGTRPAARGPRRPVGPQQGLGLPDRGPPRVVGGVRRQRPHERPLPALGPQVGVDLQRRVGEAACSSERSSLATACRRVARPARRRRATGRARTSRRRRCRSPARAPPKRPIADTASGSAAAPPRAASTGADGGLQRPADVASATSVRASPTSSTSSQPSRSAAPSGTARGGAARARRTASLGSLVAGGAAAALRATRARPARAQLGVVGEHRHRLGRAQQQVGGVPAGGQHPRHRSAAADSSRSSRRYQGVAPSASLDPPEPEQPGVGVRGVGEPAEHHRQQRALDGRARG